MKNFKKAVIALLTVVLAASMMLFITACGSQPNTYPTQIVNGSFEENTDSSTWVGWTREGSAFSARGVISEATVNGVDVDKTGDKFFSGLDGGTQKMTGTLKSDVFELTGKGIVAFKMGAAKNGDKIFVEFYEEGNETALAKVTNTDYDGTWITDHLIRKVVDLSAHVGKKIYVLVTDNDNTDDCGYVNLDDFKVCLTDEEVAAVNAERASQLDRFSEPLFEEDPTSTTIVNGGFETGDFTGWKLLNGTALTENNVISTSQYYWTDRSVYGNGDYYLEGNDNGGIAESATGAIRSTKFTLAGDGYISFMIGAASNKNCYVAICDGETDEELIKVTNDAFNDPKLALTLLRVYVDASEYLGEVLYVKVVDNNSGSGFAFINVDDFRVSMTEAEVKALQVEQYKAIAEETYTGKSYNDLASLRDYYATYKYLFELEVLKFTVFADNVVLTANDSVDLTQYIANVKAYYGSEEVTDIAITKVTFRREDFTTGFDSFDLSVAGTYEVTYTATSGEEKVSATFNVVVSEGSFDVVNGGFETGDLTGWTVLTDGWKETNGKYDGVISSSTYWGEGMPYNQSGNYHLDGWENGIGENDTWAIRSSEFVLGGSGYMTVKMGGKAAAVKVFKEDGTLVGYFTQTRFNDFSFPDVSKGSWADMGTYVMDMSDYLGETLYVELCDVTVNGSWAHAFFDELVTYYETAPDYENLYDTVKNGTPEKNDVQIAWTLAVNAIVRNGGFETGDLTGWTVLTEGWGVTDGKYDGVINASTYWGEGMPYNQSGRYHLDGWNNGIDENNTWKVRSSDFRLLGSGYMSVKMGGHAAQVNVYRASDNALVGNFVQSRFNDNSFPDVSVGSWADMATYVLDMRAFIGETLYVELCDVQVSGWAHAFFDELVTYYETAPDYENLYDTVKNGTPEKNEIQIAWVLPVNRSAVISFELLAPNADTLAKDDVNLNSFISGVKATCNFQDVTDIKIVKVVFEGNEYTEGFDAFDLTVGEYTVYYTATFGTISATESFTITVRNAYPNQVENGGFETGDLTGWTVLTEGWGSKDGKYSGVISGSTYWDEKMPYNQSGEYHLDGWANGMDEKDAWTIRSTVFNLSGSGFISVKMGGAAAVVKVFKADGTQIGHYAQSRFNDNNFPDVSKGSWADMATYVIDLSDYIGEDLYIELCDVTINGGWAHAFFDDVITYYETAPDYANMSDTVINGGENKTEVEIKWVLAVNSYVTND